MTTPATTVAAAPCDVRQRRCGHDTCEAWRLSRPGANGRQWRPCWSCCTAAAPAGETYEEFVSRQDGGGQ